MDGINIFGRHFLYFFWDEIYGFDENSLIIKGGKCTSDMGRGKYSIFVSPSVLMQCMDPQRSDIAFFGLGAERVYYLGSRPKIDEIRCESKKGLGSGVLLKALFRSILF